jgi:predicted Zn-dependent protease
MVMTLFSATTAQAHKWGNWHWNRYGSSVTIAAYTTGSQVTASKQATNDWSNNTILYIPQYTSHTDMSVFDGNYGATGWGGLASLESVSGDHILHGHARVNMYYGYGYGDVVGIQCQEVGHLFGLDHSNDGCMGKGYYNNLNSTVSHNWSDIYNMYRYTHH